MLLLVSQTILNGIALAPEAATMGVGPHSSRLEPVPRYPSSCSQPCQDSASPTSGKQPWHRQELAADWARVQACLTLCQQLLHCHNRMANTIHIGDTPRTDSSGDQRIVGCWDPWMYTI